MGCCCPPKQEQSNTTSSSKNLSSSILSVLDDPTLMKNIDFHSKNEKHFFGFPNYNELTSQLFKIQGEPTQKWISYENALNVYKDKLQIYKEFLIQVQKHLIDIILKNQSASKLTNDPYIQSNFKLDFQHCFLLELQNLYLEIEGMQSFSYMMSFTITNKAFNINKTFQTQTMRTNKRKVPFDFSTIIPLNTMDQAILDTTGHIGPPPLLFKDFYFTIQLYKQYQNDCTCVGAQVTFNMLDLQSQEVFSKVLRIQSDQGVMIAKATLRFQFIFNLRTFLEFWVDEIEKRSDQIQRILSEIAKSKSDIKKNPSGDNLNDLKDSTNNFQSLMSSTGMIGRAESNYDLPYKIT